MYSNSSPEADQLRADAVAADQRAQESWDRSDTDGFMSQWAAGLTAARLRLQAEITDNGGLAEFPALFDLAGNLVPAKRIQTRYGMSWALLSSADPDSQFSGWFNESKAQDPKRARNADARKGFYVGYVMPPAKADLKGGNATSVSAVTVRTDGGFSADAKITDNGVGDTDLAAWYNI